MKPIIKKIDDFKLYWKNYIFQSLFATIAIFILLFLLSLQNAVIIASVAATAFIVFVLPKNITARPRNIIGGHSIGLLCGSLAVLIPQPLSIHSTIIYSIAVGLSIFLMVITDTEHPPAAGTALGVAIRGFSLGVTITVITSSITLSLVHHFFKHRLRDLT